jgi:2-polyprenyl-6-hydroxyphenyl methylase / 3-demethylubiquinone-9 3-methyltransferase
MIALFLRPFLIMHSLTETEIQKFNQMADSAWDPEGPFKPLHDLNPLRMQFIERQVSIYNKTCLDVGCGPGLVTEALAKRDAAQVTGIDLAADLLTAASLHQHENNLTIDYYKSDIETFCKAHRESFDVITCLELLEHVPNPKQIIEACAHACKPGGYLFFSTINRSLKTYLKAIIGAEYLLRIIPRGTHQYKLFIKPSELAKALRETGLELIDSTGIAYHLLTKAYTLTPDLDLNYIICARKP